MEAALTLDLLQTKLCHQTACQSGRKFLLLLYSITSRNI
jgi:hypothetical protein